MKEKLIHNAKILILTLFTSAAMFGLESCEEDYGINSGEERMPLVIEGWIEENDYPIVIVTRALDLNDEDSRIEDAIEKWCRVTVYDNGEPIVLTARKNTNYNPNFIYTTNKIIGQQGHVYKLTVETEDTIAVAESTLLPCGSISRLEAIPTSENDTLYSIKAYLTNLQEEQYYKIFCKGDGEDRHFASFLGNLTGKEYNPTNGVTVSRGIHRAFTEDEEDFTHYFSSGEKVEVKLCSMGKEVYEFWKTYDLNVSLSSNMFLSFTADCPGNITGAKGYWAAYGSSTKICRIP